MYATGEYTIASCCAEYGIASESTWAKWCEEIEEIADLYKSAKDAIEELERQKDREQRLRIRKTALDKLELMVTGYEIDLVEQEVVPEAKDQEGKLIPRRILKTKIRTMHIKPNPMLIMYALNNLDGDNFVRNPEPHQAGNEKIPEKIEVEIIGGIVPAVTNEEDIVEPEPPKKK